MGVLPEVDHREFDPNLPDYVQRHHVDQPFEERDYEQEAKDREARELAESTAAQALASTSTEVLKSEEITEE